MYGIAKTLIIASVAEGFGLPLIEGLSKNLKIIASDIPVFKEIGGAANGVISYFKAGDENSLISALKNAAAAKFEKGSGWITWDGSVEMLSLIIKKRIKNDNLGK
jgi:alpha-1,2-rhamnosyltransferase